MVVTTNSSPSSEACQRALEQDHKRCTEAGVLAFWSRILIDITFPSPFRLDTASVGNVWMVRWGTRGIVEVAWCLLGVLMHVIYTWLGLWTHTGKMPGRSFVSCAGSKAQSYPTFPRWCTASCEGGQSWSPPEDKAIFVSLPQAVLRLHWSCRILLNKRVHNRFRRLNQRGGMEILRFQNTSFCSCGPGEKRLRGGNDLDGSMQLCVIWVLLEGSVCLLPLVLSSALMEQIAGQ